MGVEEIRKLKEEMSKGQGKSTLPTDGGQVSGDAHSAPFSKDRTADLRKGGGVPTGKKSLSEKDEVAKDIIAEAKTRDVEDSREETSGDERHDLVSGKEINIPPSIVQERLKMGQHPDTGEPWTRQEEKAWRDDQENARVLHQKAVAEAEQKMRDDAAAPPTAIQPVGHVPISQLTRRQKAEMQASQDAGDSPVRQAQIRDANHPDTLGRSMAMDKTKAPQQNEAEIDPELERREVEGEEENDLTRDPDEVEDELNKPTPTSH